MFKPLYLSGFISLRLTVKQRWYINTLIIILFLQVEIYVTVHLQKRIVRNCAQPLIGRGQSEIKEYLGWSLQHKFIRIS
jgi:hypothetical protein